MKRPWSQDFRCTECKLIFNTIIEHADKDNAHPCSACGHDAKPIFTPPTIFKAAFHDGHVDEGARKIAEASRIEAESFDLPPDKRGDHDREIQRLTEIKPK